MKSKRTTVFMPVLLIILCIIVCVGATHAFFTDSVSSGGNKVQSGRLSVDLEFLNRESDEWISIKEDDTPIFYNENWEPGYTDVKIMKVVNRGSLALKWEARLFSKIAVSEYADIIEVYVKFGDDEISYPQAGDTRDTYLQDWTNIGTLKDFINSEDAMASGELKNKDDSSYLAIALRMPLTAGNEYQEKVLGEFDIRILATQLTYESDAFDDQYDKDAEYPCMHINTQIKVLRSAVEATETEPAIPGEQQTVCQDCGEILVTEDCYLVFSYAANSGGFYNVECLIPGYTSTEIVIPDIVIHPDTKREVAVKVLGNNVFQGTADITSITIPDSVTSIGTYAFYNCSSLQSIDIPDSITAVGMFSFYNCTSLTSVHIPASAVSIG